MDRVMKRLLPTLVAVVAGVTTLLGYLIPYGPFLSLRDLLVRWAAVVAAFAFILGFFNVLRVHLARVVEGRPGWGYSLSLLFGLLLSLVITVAGLTAEPARVLGDWWFQYVLFPLQATAAGLVAFALAMGAFRLVRHRRRGETLLFLVTVLVVLIGTVALPGPVGAVLGGLRRWWLGVPAMAGMRGVLIGVGLGTLVVGLRVLVGMDRPHSDV